MFHLPIGRLAPSNFTSSASYGYTNPKQLSFHFLKKDADTGETREVGINDDLKIINTTYADMNWWTYVNLKDVLFYMATEGPWGLGRFGSGRCIRSVFSRDKNKFYGYFHNNGTNYSGVDHIPNIIHLADGDKDYLVWAKKLNTKNLTLDPIWATNDVYRSKLIAKINELLTKYDIKDRSNDKNNSLQYSSVSFYQLDENTLIIATNSLHNTDSALFNAILIDGKTPFPDCVLSTHHYNDTYTAGINSILDKYGKDIFKNGYTSTSLSIPIVHKDYFPYDETRRVGSDLTGKFDLYPKEYIEELPQQSVILEPMHKLGLIVSTYVGNLETADRVLSGYGNFIIFSNVLETQSPQVLNGSREFDLTFYCGERSVKRRYSKRLTADKLKNSGVSYFSEIRDLMPECIVVECSEDNLMNVYAYTRLVSGTNIQLTLLMKDADIYRTPKNKDYDYYGSFNEVPVDLYKNTEINTTSTVMKRTQFANSPQQIAVLQKGFTGKTTLSNFDDYRTHSSSTVRRHPFEESDDITACGFRDWEMIFSLTKDHTLSKSSPTKTRFPNKFANNGPTGYTEAEGIDAVADNILVDAQFDYFNDVLRDAPIYIVDTKILKTLGLSAPRYHRFMPNRCIWFEVNNLYLYDDTGKITGYNDIYATTDGTFTYALASFNFFNVKLYENVSVVTYDTQKDAMEDFTYATNTETGAVLDPVLQVCDDISEFHIAMWVPLQKAILRIGNIKLNTEVA